MSIPVRIWQSDRLEGTKENLSLSLRCADWQTSEDVRTPGSSTRPPPSNGEVRLEVAWANRSSSLRSRPDTHYSPLLSRWLLPRKATSKLPSLSSRPSREIDPAGDPEVRLRWNSTQQDRWTGRRNGRRICSERYIISFGIAKENQIAGKTEFWKALLKVRAIRWIERRKD